MGVCIYEKGIILPGGSNPSPSATSPMTENFCSQWITHKKGSGVQDSEPFKRLGRRSPHARSRISALGALKLLTPRRHSKGEVPSFRPHDRAVESILD